jgi:hypothetical protein
MQPVETRVNEQNLISTNPQAASSLQHPEAMLI